MSTADQLPRRFERAVMISVAVALIGGIAAGFMSPPRTVASEYISALVGSAGCGALCLVGVRQGGRRARWMSVLLVAVFLLDIAGRPHVPAISALALTAGAVAFIATLRSRQRLAVASTVLCSALLVATRVGGLWLR
jgi:hypothetical protein